MRYTALVFRRALILIGGGLEERVAASDSCCRLAPNRVLERDSFEIGWRVRRFARRERFSALCVPIICGGERSASVHRSILRHARKFVQVSRAGYPKMAAITSIIYSRRLGRTIVIATPRQFTESADEFARSEPGWRYFEIDASHAPNVTVPVTLMKWLREIVA